ncbi:unnamed protein product [Rotaria sp. Silwood2]|nr:unnamed protein product [Rotaria sp. Silwood2]
MSSITIIPTTTISSSNYHPIINIPPMHPSYLLPNFPHQQNPPSYHHLVQQIPKKTSLYGAGQRKYNNFNKFQTGTTTTFSGYTNMTGNRQINLPPILAPHCHLPPSSSSYHHQQQNNNYIQNLPSLLDTNPFHFPSHHNTREENHSRRAPSYFHLPVVVDGCSPSSTRISAGPKRASTTSKSNCLDKT